MLWHSYFDLLVPCLYVERGNVPDGGTNINLTSHDAVRTAACWTDQLFPKKCSRRKICEIISAIRPDSVVLVFVLQHDKVIRRVEKLLVERIRDRNLDHLSLFEHVCRTNCDCSVLLWCDLRPFLMSVSFDDIA